MSRLRLNDEANGVRFARLARPSFLKHPPFHLFMRDFRHAPAVAADSWRPLAPFERDGLRPEHGSAIRGKRLVSRLAVAARGTSVLPETRPERYLRANRGNMHARDGDASHRQVADQPAHGDLDDG